MDRSDMFIVGIIWAKALHHSAPWRVARNPRVVINFLNCIESEGPVE